MRIGSEGQRFVNRPDGSTAAPAFTLMPREAFPAPQEHAELRRNIDWAWVRFALNAGACVGIVVSPEDLEALRDAVMQTCGFDVVMRSNAPGTLMVMRPGAEAEQGE